MKKKRKIFRIILLSFFSFILTIMIALTIVLYGRVSSMMSVKEKGYGLYTMKYKQNYHLNKVLKKNLSTEEELLDFICDELYFGYKIDSNITKYGCSAFSTETIDNKHLFGRNFDLNQSY